jgi:hypothetical protein
MGVLGLEAERDDQAREVYGATIQKSCSERERHFPGASAAKAKEGHGLVD